MKHYMAIDKPVFIQKAPISKLRRKITIKRTLNKLLPFIFLVGILVSFAFSLQHLLGSWGVTEDDNYKRIVHGNIV